MFGAKRRAEAAAKRAAAQHVFRVAKESGNAIAALDVAGQHTLGVDAKTVEDLVASVRKAHAGNPKEAARQLFHILLPWKEAHEEPVPYELVHEILRGDPSLKVRIAGSYAISAPQRVELILQLMDEGAEAHFLRSTHWLIPLEHRPGSLTERAIRYALEREDVTTALVVAERAMSWEVSQALCDRLVAAVLALPASIGESQERLEKLVRLTQRFVTA